jgi:hypothetical protein
MSELSFSDSHAVLDKLAKSQAESDVLLHRSAELYGGVFDNQGAAVEEFFFNSLRAHPVVGGMTYDRVTPRLIAVRHKAHLSAIDPLEKQMQRCRELTPEHASSQLYGGVAGFSVPEASVDEAHKRGVFVLKQTGDVLAVDAVAMRAY